MGNEYSNPRDRTPLQQPVHNWGAGASTAQQRQPPALRQPPGQRQTAAQRDSKLEDIKRNVRYYSVQSVQYHNIIYAIMPCYP